MSIQYEYGKPTPTCDCCGTQLPPEDEFMDAVAAKKAEGWKSKKVAGEWMDFCPDCQEGV